MQFDPNNYIIYVKKTHSRMPDRLHARLPAWLNARILINERISGNLIFKVAEVRVFGISSSEQRQVGPLKKEKGLLEV